MAPNNRPPTLIRKSAYGRTELFLPSTSVILREVKCMGGVTRHDSASVFHTLVPARKTESVCWHCCEKFHGECIPLPRLYDSVERMYHVYGTSCSPECAKAYILEHTTFDRGQHLNVLVKMLRDVFGVTHKIYEAPPRVAFRKFGGVFDHTNTSRTSVCRVVEPPFISYSMLVEERLQMDTAMEAREEEAVVPTCSAPVTLEADSIEEPTPPGLFTDFVNERTEASAEAGVAPSASKPVRGSARKRKPDATTPQNTSGPLSGFIEAK